MKHQDGYKPSEEETKKIAELVTYLEERGYKGIVMVNKGDVGVSWVNIEDANNVRHIIMNSLAHIAQESEDTAAEIAGGIILAANQITE